MSDNEIITINENSEYNQAVHYALINNISAFKHTLSVDTIIDNMDGLMGLSKDDWQDLYDRL